MGDSLNELDVRTENDTIRKRRKWIRERIERTNPKHSRLIGAWIRCFHFMAPINCMLCLLFGSKGLATTAMVFMAIIICAYFYFQGCILSWLEKKLCQEDINIADWLLIVLNQEANNNNRNVITIYFFAFYLLAICFIYYHRFGRNN
jgi:hypothetical protein